MKVQGRLYTIQATEDEVTDIAKQHLPFHKSGRPKTVAICVGGIFLLAALIVVLMIKSEGYYLTGTYEDISGNEVIVTTTSLELNGYHMARVEGGDSIDNYVSVYVLGAIGVCSLILSFFAPNKYHQQDVDAEIEKMLQCEKCSKPCEKSRQYPKVDEILEWKPKGPLDA